MISTMSIAFGPAAKMLAQERASVVLSQQHGLRLGGHSLQSRDNLPSAVSRWLGGLDGHEALLTAHHFSADDWEKVWHDADFPAEYVARGGLLKQDFIKVLFVNSFEPSLQFVYPYPPTERLAAVLRTDTDFVDASVYDPNLEPAEVIRGFPATPLRLAGVIGQEDPQVIIQTVFNVKHDLALLCAMRERAPRARIYLGGPHFGTADVGAYLRAVPVDGIIIGDGRQALIELMATLRTGRGGPVPGILSREAAGNGPARGLTGITHHHIALPDRRQIAGLQEGHPSVWGLAQYAKRRAVLGSSGQRLLPYDMIGLHPYRVVTSQRCAKPCYWCRSPKAIDPRSPAAVADEIERHYDSCDSLHFDDNEIWFAPENFERTAEQLRQRGLTSKPVLVKTTTDQLTPPRAALLHAIGVRIIAFGVEAFAQDSLDRLRKRTTVEDNHCALQTTLAHGMKPGVNLIWLVPGIDYAKTRVLIESVVPYLRRGAYVNIVPCLDLGDLRLTPAISALVADGHARREQYHNRGMNASLDYYRLTVSPAMQSYADAVSAAHERLVEQWMPYHQGAGLSVALRSVLFLRALVQAWPDNAAWPIAERVQTGGILEAVATAVQRAEEECCLHYSPM
jgi:hypothetical protein